MNCVYFWLHWMVICKVLLILHRNFIKTNYLLKVSGVKHFIPCCASMQVTMFALEHKINPWQIEN